jgi:hypothetical protein
MLDTGKEYSEILQGEYFRLSQIINGLRSEGEVEQSIQFAVCKVEAERESLAALIEELNAPSGSDAITKGEVLAAVGKLLPYFLLNLERLCLQTGLDVPGYNPSLIKGFLNKNRDYTADLLPGLEKN